MALLPLVAQSFNAVPVTQTDLYDLLDIAQIRGLCRPLSATKPYSVSLIASRLQEINKKRRDLSEAERIVLDDYLERYVEQKDKPFTEDGNIRIESEHFPTTIGGYIGGQVSTDLGNFADSLGGSMFIGAFARGDAGRYVSWGMDFSGGLFLVDDYDTAMSYGPTGYEPYTYTKEWDGGLHPISSLSSFEQMPTSLSGGYQFMPELAAGFFENRISLRFARNRHDWGIGEGNLFLSSTARPFFSMEANFAPFDWISISSLTGVLEYGENYRNHESYHIQRTSQEQQNMYSVLQIETNPFDWLYLSFFDAAVYFKRLELGYIFPHMSKFLSQNNTGDFDNLMMGGTLGLSWPGLFRTYFSVYLDEARFNSSDFFGNYANMYSYQLGLEMPIPSIPWSTLILQYTKIEPYTYTHYYYTSAPGYSPPDSDGDGHPDYAMDNGYMNGGENLAYNLEPNSDELMLLFRSQIRRGFSFRTHYRMVRHGDPSTTYGSTYDAWGYDVSDPLITPDTDPQGAYGNGERKNFLKDGHYEWYHIISLGGTLDTRQWGEPVQFDLSYTLIFLYYTNWNASGWAPVNSSAYPNQIRNVVTFSVSVSPW